jgi:hypothetical protein
MSDGIYRVQTVRTAVRQILNSFAAPKRALPNCGRKSSADNLSGFPSRHRTRSPATPGTVRRQNHPALPLQIAPLEQCQALSANLERSEKSHSPGFGVWGVLTRPETFGDHLTMQPARPQHAVCRLMQRAKGHRHSITSSAWAISEAGRLRPSILRDEIRDWLSPTACCYDHAAMSAVCNPRQHAQSYQFWSNRSLSTSPRMMTTLAWIAANWPIPEHSKGSRIASRVGLGAITLSKSSHFSLRLYSNVVTALVLRPPARVRAYPIPTGSMTLRTRSGVSGLLQCYYAGAAAGNDDIRRQRDQFCRAISVGIVRTRGGSATAWLTKDCYRSVVGLDFRSPNELSRRLRTAGSKVPRGSVWRHSRASKEKDRWRQQVFCLCKPPIKCGGARTVL